MSQPTASRAAPLMWALFWATGLALLTFFISEWLTAQDNPNRRVHSTVSGEVREVRLQRNRTGHYVATGAINGSTVQFMVDTGATYVGIPGQVAERLGLRSNIVSSSKTAGGIVSTYLVTLQHVALGDIVVSNVRASIIPDMPGEQVLLGMSMLRDLELNQRDGTLLLRQVCNGDRSGC